MRFAFTEQQLELRSAIRSVLERQCTAGDLRALADLRRTGAHAHGDPGRAEARWAVLRELGAPGLCVPAEHGGLGLREVDFVGVAEEAGWAALPEPLVESATLAAPLLADAAERSPEGARHRGAGRRHAARAGPRGAGGDRGRRRADPVGSAAHGRSRGRAPARW